MFCRGLDASVPASVCPLFGKGTGLTPAAKYVGHTDAHVDRSVRPLDGKATRVTGFRIPRERFEF